MAYSIPTGRKLDIITHCYRDTPSSATTDVLFPKATNHTLSIAHRARSLYGSSSITKSGFYPTTRYLSPTKHQSAFPPKQSVQNSTQPAASKPAHGILKTILTEGVKIGVNVGASIIGGAIGTLIAGPGFGTIAGSALLSAVAAGGISVFDQIRQGQPIDIGQTLIDAGIGGAFGTLPIGGAVGKAFGIKLLQEGAEAGVQVAIKDVFIKGAARGAVDGAVQGMAHAGVSSGYQQQKQTGSMNLVQAAMDAVMGALGGAAGGAILGGTLSAGIHVVQNGTGKHGIDTRDKAWENILSSKNTDDTSLQTQGASEGSIVPFDRSADKTITRPAVTSEPQWIQQARKDYVAELRKNYPKHSGMLDFANRVESGELDEQSLLNALFSNEYKKIRHIEYENYPQHQASVIETAAKETVDMDVNQQNGWYYRMPKNRKQNGWSTSGKAVERLSVNVWGDPSLIKALDDYIVQNNLKAYYKCPDYDLNWHLRPDPITIYFHESASDEAIEGFKKLLDGYGRRDQGWKLIGRRVNTILAKDVEPNEQRMNELIQIATQWDAKLGEGVKRYFTHHELNQPPKLKASAGQFAAVLAILKKQGISSSQLDQLAA